MTSKNLIESGVKQLASNLNIDVDANEFYSIISASCFRGEKPSHAQLAAFLVLANQYKLNPLTKEIYAFPSNGGIQPIIAIDGWIKIAHSSGDLRGITHELIWNKDQTEVVAVKCILSRDGWDFNTETVEFMSENKRRTPTWNQYPVRMLKHRATAQAIRMAFNVNAMLEDEAEAMNDNPSHVNSSSSVDEDRRKDIISDAESKARISEQALREYWQSLEREERQAVGNDEIERIKKLIPVEADYEEVKDDSIAS